MKFTIPRFALFEVLGRLSVAVGGKAGTPEELSNVIIELSNQTLAVTAFSSLMTVQGLIGVAGVEGSISFAVSGKLLKDLLGAITSEEVSVEVLGKTVLISTENNKYTFTQIDLENLPRVPSFNKGGLITIPLKDFISSLQKVSYCGAVNDSRAFLKGVCVNHKHFVATDGFRLAMCPNNIVPLTENYIIPLDSVSRIIRLFTFNESIEARAEFTTSKFTIIASTAYVSIAATSRIMAGKYPSYESILPKEKFSEVCLDKKYLSEIIKRTMFFVDGKKQLTFKFSTTELLGGSLELSADTQKGAAVEHMPCECIGFGIKTASHTITLNGGYFLDIIKRIEGDTVKLRLRESSTLVEVREADFVNVMVIVRK